MAETQKVSVRLADAQESTARMSTFDPQMRGVGKIGREPVEVPASKQEELHRRASKVGVKLDFEGATEGATEEGE